VTQQVPSDPFRGRRARGPSLQAALVAFISLVILFLWLNFVLAQEIVSMGREIQEKNGELRALERQNDALLREISVAGSERNLAQRAKALGYRTDMPVYLTVDEPIIGSIGDDSAAEDFFASLTAEERRAEQSDPIWALLQRQLGWHERIPGP
jgi:cell division protein FtsB